MRVCSSMQCMVTIQFCLNKYSLLFAWIFSHISSLLIVCLSLSVLNCFELHQLCVKHISHNKVNIGSGGTHDAYVVYPWFCAPDPVCLLFSSQLRAFTVPSSTNYFFKEGGWGRACRQTHTGWLFLSINILKATIVHFSRDFIKHPQRLNTQSVGEEGRRKGWKKSKKGVRKRGREWRGGLRESQWYQENNKKRKGEAAKGEKGQEQEDFFKKSHSAGKMTIMMHLFKV